MSRSRRSAGTIEGEERIRKLHATNRETAPTWARLGPYSNLPARGMGPAESESETPFSLGGSRLSDFCTDASCSRDGRRARGYRVRSDADGAAVIRAADGIVRSRAVRDRRVARSTRYWEISQGPSPARHATRPRWAISIIFAGRRPSVARWRRRPRMNDSGSGGCCSPRSTRSSPARSTGASNAGVDLRRALFLSGRAGAHFGPSRQIGVLLSPSGDHKWEIPAQTGLAHRRPVHSQRSTRPPFAHLKLGSLLKVAHSRGGGGRLVNLGVICRATAAIVATTLCGLAVAAIRGVL